MPEYRMMKLMKKCQLNDATERIYVFKLFGIVLAFNIEPE